MFSGASAVDNCRLCLDQRSRAVENFWNAPLAESENFWVLPSLGALVEGWLLVVPKDHYLCMGAMPDILLEEMSLIASEVGDLIKTRYGQVCKFEHGPAQGQLNVGCGVDHAHMHILPVQQNLISASERYLPEGSHWNRAQLYDCSKVHRNGESYLYLEQEHGNAYIATHNGFASQILRRAVADSLQKPQEYDWKQYAQEATVRSTMTVFEELIRGDSECQATNLKRFQPA